MSDFYFKYKRIVLVDSADICYAELPLDQHAILLGKGNVGKSSILNALRLFLLPEVNFAKCESKFAFRTADKNSYYSKDQSFQHYFPSSTSFMILEVENFTGSHCQILTRGSGYQYHRLFVPLPYEQIRDLFWSCHDGDDGIGKAVKHLSFTFLREQIKKRTPEVRFVRDPDTLKKLLYACDFMHDAETRYSLFPLVEQEASKISSLRSLFLLLFDMNADSKAMSNAIANIIEADKKSSDDILNFNIDDFLNRHEELEREEQTLTSVKNKEHRFKQLHTTVMDYTQLSEADKDYAGFIKNLAHQKAQTLQTKQDLEKTLKPLQETLDQHDRDLKVIHGQLANINTQLTSRQTDLNGAQKAETEGDAIWKQFYADLSIDEAIAIAGETRQEKAQQLKAFNNDLEAQKRRGILEQRIQISKATQQKLEASARNKEFILSQQLAPAAKQVLAAVNKKLIQANPGRVLNAQEMTAIEQFTAIFRQSPDAYDWFDISFGQQSTNIFDDLEQQAAKVAESIQTDENELNKLQQPSGTLHHQKNLKELEDQIKELEYRVNMLQKYPGAKVNITTYQEQLVTLHAEKGNIEDKRTAAQKAQQKSKTAYQAIKPQHDALIQTLDLTIRLENRSHHLKNIYTRLKMAEATELSPETEQPLTEDTLDAIEKALKAFDQKREEIVHHLHYFIAEKVVDDEDNIRVNSPLAKDIKSTFKRLQEVFDELPQKRNILEEQIVMHNQSVSQYTHVLTSHAEHIEAFKHQLNRDFKTITINDLDKVEVEIGIDRKFSSLVAEINKADFHGDALLSDKFYERLKVFVNSFFDGKSDNRLTMDKIVTSLQYRIKKQGNDNWQTKQQSNSTTALINLQLAQLLLNRIRKAGCSVTFPLVHDELADINIDQFDWLLPHLTEHGFRLFSAATYSASPELIHKIGHFHEIGSMRTAYPYHADRTIVYWGDAEQFTSEEAAKSSSNLRFTDQSSLVLTGS
ncbi:MAG: Unknown protein [uncultured Thiotrichaceae bacterium]|uniref:Uncharacterized protein n=1 Tax=uncultured Thiotrichaceae bacterium TaxID=298394 RepID=A0A6S6TDT2_9GAMM|nr:MAG: Unknown protein [uncultured Thiotrichaceae bacterium]